MIPALDVFEEESSVIDVVSVLGSNLDSLKARCLFDDGSVKNGVVESGGMQGSLCVLSGQAFWVCGGVSDGQGDIVVVIVVVMPESDGQFTLGDYVVQELPEFGSSVVFSDGEAILC